MVKERLEEETDVIDRLDDLHHKIEEAEKRDVERAEGLQPGDIDDYDDDAFRLSSSRKTTLYGETSFNRSVSHGSQPSFKSYQND